MTLTELAERCEQAPGPDYALDCAIWDAVYPGERDERFHKLSTEGPYSGRLGPADKDGYVQPLRAFTASLDAAMTLVPEGWDGALYLAADTHKPEVQLETPAMRRALSMDDERVEGSAVTLPLAMCAAALRARAAAAEITHQLNHREATNERRD